MLNDDKQRKALYEKDIDARDAYRQQHHNVSVWQDAYEDIDTVDKLFTSMDITNKED